MSGPGPDHLGPRNGRGGPQRIPRPSAARPGGPPPWGAVPEAARRVDLGAIRAGLAHRGPGRVVLVPGREHDRLSAVLVPLYVDDLGAVRVVLTRRARHLRSHTWEVSFPGGGHEHGDPSLWHTALREAHEEVGLDPASARLIGELDRFVTVGSRTLVHPYVAEIDPPGELVPDPAEVEAVLHVALAELLLDEVFREELWPIGDELRPITFFELHGDTVWGATAAMLRQLLALATGTDPTLTR